MTENKRFTMCHEQNDINGWTMSIVDCETKEPFEYTTYEVHSSSITDTKDEMEDLCLLLNELNDENEQLKTENTMLKEHQNINCQNCQYFVSDSVSSDCLKREDIGYKGICIDGMDLHMLAKNCPYY